MVATARADELQADGQARRALQQRQRQRRRSQQSPDAAEDRVSSRVEPLRRLARPRPRDDRLKVREDRLELTPAPLRLLPPPAQPVRRYRSSRAQELAQPPAQLGAAAPPTPPQPPPR